MWSFAYIILLEKESCGIASNVLDCSIVMSEFELQSRYYIHFRENTFINPLTTPAIG